MNIDMHANQYTPQNSTKIIKTGFTGLHRNVNISRKNIHL